MACYHPIPAYQGGSEPPRLWPPIGTANLQLPCGKCLGCRTAKATEWANRCTHETSQWKHNIFLTLTYDDEHLPKEAHLVPRDLTLFIKRLRKNADSPGSSAHRDRSSGIRYFACGEYGERNGRPHYHALLFNYEPGDKTTVGGQGDTTLYTSRTLEQLWPYGQHTWGKATPGAAGYIAQYNLKKQGQGNADADGVYRPAPFLRMSLRPAIGATWLSRYAQDIQQGYIVENGRRHTIPRYYKTKLQGTDNAQYLELAEYLKQRYRIQNPSDRGTPERLQAEEIIHKRRKQLTEKRKL